MQMGPWQILVIAIVVLVLFGRGKISALMGEVGKGITAFKKGVTDQNAAQELEQQTAARDANETTPSSTSGDKV
jgi:sec-independent protein translocase protein TatA